MLENVPLLDAIVLVKRTAYDFIRQGYITLVVG